MSFDHCTGLCYCSWFTDIL